VENTHSRLKRDFISLNHGADTFLGGRFFIS